MLRKIYKKLSGLIKGKSGKKKFPYTYYQSEFGVKFRIHNPIEEVRLKGWGHEEAYVKEMLNELRSDDIFFDIGSSVGLISILAAKKLAKGKVISFEPDPENIRSLTINYEINHLSNFQVQEMGVGDVESTMDLFTAGSGSFSPSLRKVNGIERSIRVRVNTIDNLLRLKEVPCPTVVKIDIEGAEMMALKGMEQLLKSPNRPRLVFIEIHPDFLKSFNTSESEIDNFLAKLNYTVDKSQQRDRQVLCKLVVNK